MRVLQHILMGAIRLYRWLVSPVLTALFSPDGLCRYNPSCSEYALQAIQIHGPFRGSWLAFKRILRCNPWGSFGFDPVPPKADKGCGCGAPEHKHDPSPKTDANRPSALLSSGIDLAPRPTSF